MHEEGKIFEEILIGSFATVATGYNIISNVEIFCGKKSTGDVPERLISDQRIHRFNEYD